MNARIHALLHRTAFALGVAARSTVQAMGFPLRAAGRLLARWRRPGSELDPPRQLPAADEPPPPRRPLPRRREVFRAEVAPPATDPALRCQRARDAAELPPAEASRVILELLHDPDPDVRRAAAESAGRARCAEATFSLILCLDDPAPVVRDAAERAVRRITGRAVDLPRDGSARGEQIEQLKQWWKERRLADLTTGLTRKDEA